MWRAPKMWNGGECWIIGGGPSLPREFDVPTDIIKAVVRNELMPSAYARYLSAIHNKHIIGINNAYRLGAWVDVCHFGDCGWYLHHRLSLSKFPGLKITCCPNWRNKISAFEGVKFLSKDPDHQRGITLNNAKVSWNAHSGGSAINIAVHFGVKRIILLGFDMCRAKDGTGHWHDSHGTKGKKNIPFKLHLRGFERIAIEAKALGVEIINANLRSKIKQFPKVSVKDLL